MENKAQHPTKSDYCRIQDFTDTLVNINSSISKLNNHLEVLKRVGDIETLRDFDHKLFEFRVSIISEYCSTLKVNIDDKED